MTKIVSTQTDLLSPESLPTELNISHSIVQLPCWKPTEGVRPNGLCRNLVDVVISM